MNHTTNRFFTLSAREQRNFRLKAGATAGAGILLVIGGLYLFAPALLFLGVALAAVVLGVLAPFFDVPGLVRRGRLRYLSTFLLAEPARYGVVTLHGATLFDYYFSLDTDRSGRRRTARVLAGYLDGLLRLLDTEPDDTVVRGTTYLLNVRTAGRAGLHPEPTDGLQRLLLLANFPRLAVELSYLKRRLVWPRLSAVRTYSGTVGEVREHAAALRRMSAALARTYEG